MNEQIEKLQFKIAELERKLADNKQQLELEAALERVRNRTMAMHKSEEITEVVKMLYHEFDKLKINNESTEIEIGLIDEETGAASIWAHFYRSDGNISTFLFPFKHFPVSRREYEVWRGTPLDKRKHLFFTYEYSGDDWQEFIQLADNLPELQEIFRPLKEEDISKWVTHNAYFSHGLLTLQGVEAYAPEILVILKRFASLFEQTYTRFLDLQKAEDSAREAQIEASLERVRAKTMGMHSSEDVTVATETMFNELQKLGINNLRCGIANIHHNKTFDVFGVTNLNSGNTMSGFGLFGINEHPIWQRWFESWKNKEEVFIAYIAGQEKEEYFNNINNHQDYLPQQIVQFPDNFFQAYHFDQGAVWAYSLLEHSKPEREIMKRFASVFSLTFRRYQDLKKAEANAREAQIEASLERVRARTMAMHNSEDVTVATETMFNELHKLGINNLRGGIANIHHNKTFDVFGVTNLNSGNTMSGFGLFGMDEHPIWQRWFESWKNDEEVFIAYIAGQEKEEYFNNINNHQDYLPQQIVQFPDNFFQAYHFDQGAVWAYSLLEHSKPEREIMKRFASVFSLTFRRYQDLKKAEDSAREAQIEASLERVRARTMAMHNSEDVTVATETMFNELQKLGINNLRGGIANIHQNKTFDVFTVTNLNSGNTMRGFNLFSMNEHPIWQRWFESWRNNEEVFIAYMAGQEKEEYFNNINNHQNYLPQQIVQFPDNFFQAYHFDQGALYAYSLLEHTKPDREIMKRFASVFSLTFHRYQDLKKAEANAREAIKQAALDRIRAEIASMRSVSDLERITPLIWNELKILGVPFIRCGVFIMDDSQQLIHTFLSTPEGKAIAAFQLPYNTPGHFREVIDHWRTRKIYISLWSEVDFISIGETLVEQGAIATKEQYLDTLPKGGFYLHFLPFLQGMLYVGNITQLCEEDIKLIQHVADAFSTAYARYEDFNKLEAAKQQVDKTLGDLKQAQKQLIQSEKMASLGELTAGIAHEIQNPLNFINNFSEVSNELIDEMKEELATGNQQLATEMADDIKRNLEKINHHGKRADAIVKGMLQHSRSNKGQKEPTDINSLCDEYLRLSYHGLRAKDKTFNAKFKTDFDEQINKINIIPQDIGRVLLNLFNNAFYAVNEKKQKLNGAFEPQVIVATKKETEKLIIKITDNGFGIPQNLIDKIFQPFFTTKPTGKGTGLGLSLSYDIVKAHRGEIKVESIEGEGCEFVIELLSKEIFQ